MLSALLHSSPGSTVSRFFPFRPPGRFRAALAAAALAGAVAAVAPEPLAAQTAGGACDPAQPGCEFRPPLVEIFVDGVSGTSFSFGGSTAQKAVAVTVAWCDEAGLDRPSHRVLLDGTALATTFTAGQKTGCHAYGTTQVTVQLTPGSHTLRAEIRDAVTGNLDQPGGNLGSDEAALAYVYTPPPPPDTTTPVYGVSVDAAPQAVTRAAGGAATERFTVRNTGNRETTYTLSCAGVAGCAASGASVTVPAGGDASVGVTYRVPSGGAAVWLKAWRAEAASVRDSAMVPVSAGTASSAGYVGEAGAFSRQDRAACVVLAAGPGAAAECGDLRLAHALPATTVLGTPRAPTLLYNSQHARPYPVVAAHVTPPAGETPVRVRAVLRMAAGDTAGGTWAGWPAGTARRVVLGFDASHLPTGVYGYTLEVTAEYAAQAPVVLLSRAGSVTVVNRRESAFGAGWWVAGLEQLLFPADTTTRLWVGGDGSTRLYRKTAARTYVADAFDRADTLYYVGPSYERRLPGDGRVVFGSAGRHLRTESRLGLATHFVWGDAGRLAEIHLPRGQGFDTGLMYRLEYANPGTRLSRVLAPGAVEGQPRPVSVTMDGTGRIGWISGPDSTAVGFGYTGTDLRVTSRTDRRGVATRYAYGAGSRLETVRTPLTAGDTATVTFRPAESQGVQGTAASPADQVFTYVDGPRTDVQDITRFYLDRWGAPVRLRDALGNSTLVTRGDARWPALVTSVKQANGREVTATYDDRGRLVAAADWGTVPTHGRPATTLYELHPVWDAPVRVTSPGGAARLFGYDALGRPEWAQEGLDPARRTVFGYHDLASATAPGMLRTVTAPDGQTETVEYNAQGNVSATVGPTGVRSERELDRIGRVTLQKHPGGGWMRPAYDAMDRVVETETFGPATQFAMEPRVVGTEERPELRLYVHTYFDRAGGVDSVARWQTPDPGAVGRLTTRWRRDLAGRVEAEVAPDGHEDLMQYDVAGNLTGLRNRRLQWTHTEFDVLGRPKVQRTDAAQYAPVHDDRGGLGPSWHFPFFAQDAERNYTQPNTTGQGLVIPGDTAYFDYDVAGNLVRADNRDARIRRAYHLTGTLAADTLRIRTYAGQDFDAHVYGMGYEYDLDGRRTRLRHPQGIAPQPGTPAATEYTYDPVSGALATVRDPLGLVYRYGWNTAGQVTSLDRAPVVETFDYDAAGQLWHRHEAVSGTAVHADTLTYDPVTGKTLRAGTRTGVTDLAFNGMGALAWSGTQLRGDLSQSQEEYWTDPLANQVASELTQLGPVNPAPERTRHTLQAGTGRVTASTRYSDSNQPVDGGWNAFDASGNTVRFDQWRLVSTPYGTPGCEGFWGCSAGTDVPANLRETALYYYGADQRLRVVDRRACLYFAGATGLPGCDPQYPVSYQHRPAFEEYRYDALGRRVLVRTRSEYMCRYTCLNTLRRIVWDGDQVLYEISAPGGSGSAPADRERDTGLAVPAYLAAGEESPSSPRPDGYFGPMAARAFPYGRVMYVHGAGLDAPLALYRMEYSDSLVAPQRVVPHADWRGSYDGGFWGMSWRSDCKLVRVSQTLDPDSTPEHIPGGEDASRTTRPDLDYWHCLDVDWPAQRTWSALQFRPGFYGPRGWMGSLIHGSRDASGLYYRRNRYYDPETGRFTQEDPIGMAGGINVYGFANGDPVHFADPFGLDWDCKQSVTLTRRQYRQLEREGHDVGAMHRGGCIRTADSAEAAALTEEDQEWSMSMVRHMIANPHHYDGSSFRDDYRACRERNNNDHAATVRQRESRFRGEQMRLALRKDLYDHREDMHQSIQLFLRQNARRALDVLLTAGGNLSCVPATGIKSVFQD